MATWSFDATTVRVIDGDTQVFRARVMEDTQRDFVVRLLEIDTPERRGPDKRRGDEAAQHAHVLLFSREGVPLNVRLELSGKRDVYGRWLGWVKLGERDLAAALIEAGHGEGVDYEKHLVALTQR